MNSDASSAHPLDPVEEAIFNAAIGITDPESRRAFLDRACGSDAKLRERLDALLRAEQQALQFFADDPFALTARKALRETIPMASSATASEALEKAGDRIGRYKLLEKIGEGGCGVVFMAEQEEPVRRKVALKIIKAGMDSQQVVARFEAERQALALMDHPNIAQFFDAGVMNEGRAVVAEASNEKEASRAPVALGARPYFVMELVRGIRITDYCVEKKLSTQERLDLFIQVCRAVQHAHQKGIIHRDLKPSNVMVTENDGKAVPKVIDFGIAKATQGRLTDKTVFTQFAAFMGTPAYMSPEQAAMTSLDIDTRSDIYSLGVLLYELLTGTTPFDGQELLKAGFDEMRRIIREVDPPTPSTRHTHLQANRGKVSDLRHANPRNLKSRIEQDLDWIVMKCLEKDRSRRYETANALADDLHSFLRDEAIAARPPSAMYRFRKVVRRNRWAWASAATVALSLVIGLILATGQATRARREFLRAMAAEAKAKSEAASSEQVARFLARMLEGVGPSVALGRDTTLLREILAKTEKRMFEDLIDQPEAEARLCASLARVYFELDDFSKAESMAKRVLELRYKLNGGEHATVRDALQSLGDIYDQRGDYVHAEAMHREGLALLRRLGLAGGKVEALQLNSLGNALAGLGKDSEAETMYRKALELLRQGVGKDSLDPGLLVNLALICDKKGDHVEAERLGRQSIEIFRKNYPNGHPHMALALSNLANALKDQGKLDEAAKLGGEAVVMLRKLMGNQNAAQVQTMETLINILHVKGDLAEAEALSRNALAIRRQAPTNNQGLANTLSTLASVLIQRGQLTEAEVHARESQELWRRVQGSNEAKWQDGIVNTGLTLFQRDRREEALKIFHGLLTLQRKLLGAESVELANTFMTLSFIQLKHEGDPILGERYARQAAEIRQKHYGPDHKDVINALNNVAYGLQYQGRLEEAERVFRHCLVATDKNESATPAARRNPLDSLIECLLLQGKEAEVVALVESEWKRSGSASSQSPEQREEYLADFAAMFSKCHRYAKAEPLYRELIASRVSRLPNDHSDLVKAKASLGNMLADWAWIERGVATGTNTQPFERAREAERCLREVLAIQNKQPLRSSRRLGDTRSRLGAALLSLAFLEPGLAPEKREVRLREAESEMLNGQDTMARSNSTDLKYLRQGLERLVRLYDAWSKPEEASIYLAKLKTFELAEVATKTRSSEESSP